MFPIYIKQPNSKPPKTDIHYIIAKNGIFLHKRNGWIAATVPVKQIAVLDEQPIGMKILLPNIPRIVTAKVVRFFRAVYEEYKSEAVILLHFSKEKGWETSVPAQTVSAAKVDYDPKERLEGYNCMGTMHSHPMMSAFHSEIDIPDEAEQDGIHITIGDLNDQDCFSLDGEVVINGTRFSLNHDFLEGLKEVKNKTVFFSKVKKFYAVECPSLNGWVVPEEWINRVEKKTYLYVYSSMTPTAASSRLGVTDMVLAITPTIPKKQEREKLEKNVAKKKKSVGNAKVTNTTGGDVKNAG